MLSKPVDQISEIASKKAHALIKEMKSGAVSSVDWNQDLLDNKVTLKEMIGTDSGAEEFLEKVMLEAYQELDEPENAPLYTPFYAEVEDSSLPKVLTIEEMGPYGIVFLEHLEGGEVKFGTLEPGQEKVVRMRTLAAGLEYTEDMVEYNEFFRVTDQARAMARAWIATVNYAAFAPFVLGTFVTTAGGLLEQREAQYGRGAYDPTAQLIAFNTSVQQTLRDAVTVLPNAKYIICNSADQLLIEDAIAGAMLPDLEPSVVKRKLRPENIIVWDGFEVQVGAKTYSYPGVTSGTVYLVSGAKTNFKFYFKHKLRITQDGGDLSRLIVTQVVGRSRGGSYAAIAGRDGAVEVEIES